MQKMHFFQTSKTLVSPLPVLLDFRHRKRAKKKVVVKKFCKEKFEDFFFALQKFLF